MSATRKIKRFQDNLGHSWWWRRFADLVDRKNEDGTYRPFDFEAAVQAQGQLDGVLTTKPIRIRQPGAEAPPMLARPEGMTRQQHRRLYRESCKLAGVPWRTPRLFKTPRRERGRNWKDLSPEQLAELDAQWAEYMKSSLKVE